MINTSPEDFIKNEEGFKVIADLMSDFIWLADKDGNFLFLNRKWRHFLGITRMKLKREDFDRFGIRTINFDKVRVDYVEKIESKKQWTQTFAAVDTKGNKRWFLTNAQPVYDKNGNLYRWIGHNTDITKQKKVEDELRVSNSRYELATMSTLDTIWDWDIKNDKLTWSPSLNKVYGYRLTNLTTASDWAVERFHPEDRQRVADIIFGTVQKRSKFWKAEYRFRRADGRYAYVVDRGYTLFDKSGEPIRMVGAMTDVTLERKTLDILKNAKENAEKASEAKTAFLANVSHEIRTPLSSMIGYVELIQDGTVLGKELKEYCDIIIRNGQQVITIVDDVLDLERVEAGSLAIKPKDFSIDAVLNDVKKILENKILDKDVVFKIKKTKDVPNQLNADPIRLKQIMINLAGNALKFTNHGEVLLSVDYLEPCLRIHVKDTGIGIAKKNREIIFDPFKQADQSISKRFGGTGLGLALTRKIARSMNGDVILKHSELGRGSEFEAIVMAKHVGNEEAGKVESNSALHGKKILVIDDSKDIRVLVSTILRKNGAQVYCASNGVIGIDMALKNKFDLILLDIQMPEMDGYETLAKLKSFGVKAPVSALTAHAMNEERDKAILAGFDGFITKPMRVENVINMLGRFY